MNMTKYSTQLKIKLVLEVLEEEQTLNEIANEYNINILECKNINLNLNIY
jgi:transposase-like protein